MRTFFLANPLLDQLDNNLPVVPFASKMARLNSECSDPALQTNCIEGQKWRCINEDGQWRKHKCKFHVSSPHNSCIMHCFSKLYVLQLQLQSHLAEINKVASPNKRNCACFTPQGLVYTKIKTKRSYIRRFVFITNCSVPY